MDRAAQERLAAIVKGAAQGQGGIERPIITDALRDQAVSEIMAFEVPTTTIVQSCFDVRVLPNANILLRIAPYLGDLDEIAAGEGVMVFEKVMWSLPIPMAQALLDGLPGVIAQAEQLRAQLMGLAPTAEQVAAADSEPDSGALEADAAEHTIVVVPELHCSDGDEHEAHSWADQDDTIWYCNGNELAQQQPDAG